MSQNSQEPNTPNTLFTRALLRVAKRKREESPTPEKRIKLDTEAIDDLDSPPLAENVTRTNIKAISNDNVLKLQSTQVIVTLESAVKELLENALDAKATMIDVRFKNYGLDLFEVQDNGTGIHSNEFNSLMKRHHTSKLSTFDDLSRVLTYGFRGEALSSLAAVTQLSIATKHDEDASSVCLKYDHKGNVISNTPAAHPRGTTVKCEQLFGNFSVRKKELAKNIKKEFTKCCNMIQAYALIADGVRITVTCHGSSSSSKRFVVTWNLIVSERQIMLSSSGKSLRDNIASIYGAKQFATLTPVALTVEKLKINGYISKNEKSCGRGTADRQNLYVNQRPVIMPKVSKAINEIYKQFHSMFPVYVLDITLPTGKNIAIPNSLEIYDVNVTPDKKTLFFENEVEIVNFVRRQLVIVWENRSFAVQKNLDTFVSSQDVRIGSYEYTPTPDSQNTLTENVFDGVKTPTSSTSTTPQVFKTKTNDKETTPVPTKRPVVEEESDSEDEVMNIDSSSEEEKAPAPPVVQKKSTFRIVKSPAKPSPAKPPVQQKLPIRTKVNEVEEDVQQPRYGQILHDMNHKCDHEHEHEDDSDSDIEIVQDVRPKFISESKAIDISQETLLEQFRKLKPKPKKQVPKSTRTKYQSKSSLEAEKDLNRIISKNDFQNMEIIGQFNKGFIIAKLREDIFIIDQHASDEKYNFETLQRTTALNTQPLIVPKRMELPVADELIVRENLEIFKKNGFLFHINDDAEPTKRVSLLTVPTSKNTVFNENDANELIAMIHNGGCEHYRPSKVRSMFASRACRMSIMIGKKLDDATMNKVVKNLSGLDQPWNCPHGRPTMRHLCSSAALDNHRIEKSKNMPVSSLYSFIHKT